MSMWSQLLRFNWRDRTDPFRLSDAFTAARVTLSHHAMRLLPTDTVSWIGSRVARSAGPKLHPKADRRVRLALKALRPDIGSDSAALEAATARYWDSQGRTYAEFSAEDRLWDEGRVKVKGAEHLASARHAGRAVIVAGVHIGNWEVLPISFGYLGHRFVQVYQPLPNSFENRIAVRTRMRANERVGAASPGAGCRLLSPSPSASVELLRALKGGESFMMFVDEEVNKRVRAPAFDTLARTDGNMGRVVRLARMSDAALIPAYVLRGRGAHFTVYYLPALSVAVTNNRSADVRDGIASLNSIFAEIIRENIDQWYMLMNWKEM